MSDDALKVEMETPTTVEYDTPPALRALETPHRVTLAPAAAELLVGAMQQRQAAAQRFQELMSVAVAQAGAPDGGYRLLSEGGRWVLVEQTPGGV